MGICVFEQTMEKAARFRVTCDGQGREGVMGAAVMGQNLFAGFPAAMMGALPNPGFGGAMSAPGVGFRGNPHLLTNGSGSLNGHGERLPHTLYCTGQLAPALLLLTFIRKRFFGAVNGNIDQPACTCCIPAGAIDVLGTAASWLLQHD